MSEKQLLIDQYVLETPDQCIKNIRNSYTLTLPLVQEYLKQPYPSVAVVASGSSYNACQCALPFMKKYLKCPVEILTPFTFEHYDSDYVKDSFLFVVSQSGTSTNAISALKKVKNMNIKAIGISGNLDNDFQDYADLVIDYGVDGEIEPYVTKGVTTLALFLMLFSLEIALTKGILNQDCYNIGKMELNKVFEVYNIIQSKTIIFIDRHIKELSSLTTTYMCSGGGAMGAACEGALKFSELLKIPCIPLEAEEYIHGYNLQLSPLHTVFFLDTCIESSERITSIYQATKKVTDRAYMITVNPKLIDDPNVIYLSDVPDQIVSSLYCLPFFQLIAFHITTYNNSLLQHPLLKDFNQIVSSKSEKYAKDYIRRLNCDFY
ncbi:MAG: SIS domain-containing protein [Herbinix sp.]|nr:SIS domain-containing protein [Herbinix sp.]